MMTSYPCMRRLRLEESSAIAWLEIDCAGEGAEKLEELRRKFASQKYQHFLRVCWRDDPKCYLCAFHGDKESKAKELFDALRQRRGGDLKAFGLGKKINPRSTQKESWFVSKDLVSDPDLADIHFSSSPHLAILPQATGQTQVTGTGGQSQGVEQFRLAVTDLDTLTRAAVGQWHQARSLALPLLCADDWYGVDPRLAAKAAINALKTYLDNHPEDKQLRIVMVETAGSRALAELQAHNTISDPRLVVATSARPSALVELAQVGLPCSCIALEADTQFHQGRRPRKSRSRLVYDKSGPEGSVHALEVLTKAQHACPPAGPELGQAYLVKTSASSPLSTRSACCSFAHVVVPSRRMQGNANVVADDAAVERALGCCYASLFDLFARTTAPDACETPCNGKRARGDAGERGEARAEIGKQDGMAKRRLSFDADLAESVSAAPAAGAPPAQSVQTDEGATAEAERVRLALVREEALLVEAARRGWRRPRLA